MILCFSNLRKLFIVLSKNKKKLCVFSYIVENMCKFHRPAMKSLSYGEKCSDSVEVRILSGGAVNNV